MRWWKLGVAVVVAVLAVGCGSEPTIPATITVTPTAVTVAPQATQQFAAAVSGVSNTAVNWAVNDIAGGNSTVGTISSTGLYTAPATTPSPATVTVKATSVERMTASATASVTIDSGVRVSVSPAMGALGTAEMFQFTATVTGTTNTAVNWLVNDVAGGNATVGTISATGSYTAPAMVPSPAAVTVRATSTVDTTRSGTSTVSIVVASDPTLTAINPAVTAQGSLFHDLYLTGTNFLSSTTVRVNVNGTITTAPATLISSTLLRARIPESLLSTAGPVAVDVQRQNGTTSAALNLTVAPVRPALVAAAPDSVAQGDAVTVNLHGGYYGTAASPAVTAEFDGQPQPQGASVLNPRQLDVRLVAPTTGGLYSLAVRNSAAAQPLAAVNLAVQPSASASVLATLPVGMRPVAVAVNTATGVAVVANRDSDSVSLINLATNMVTSTITVGDMPTGVAVDNQRNVALVVNNASNNVSVVNLGSGQVTTITGVGMAPFAVGVNPLTGLAIVVNQSASTASVIDLANNSVVATVNLTTGANPAVAIEPRLNWAIVAPGGAGSVAIVDLARRSTAMPPVAVAPLVTVTLGTGVRGVAINTETERALLTDPSAAFVLLFSVLDQRVSGLTLETGHVAAAVNPLTDIAVTVNDTTDSASILDLRTPIRLGTVSLPTNANPRAVAIDPGSNVAVVVNEGTNNVSIISLGAIRPLHVTQISPATTLAVGPAGPGLALSVTGFGFMAGALVRLDGTAVGITTTVVSDRQLIATVPATMLAGPRRYVLDVENPGPVRSNVTDLAVIQAVTVGTAPRAVAIDASRDLAVVTNNCSNDISLINLNTGTVTSTVAVGTNPQGVALLPRLGRAVVTNRGSNNASLVDLVAGTVTSTVTVGTEPIGVAIQQDTGMAVVANSGSNTLSLFPADTGGMPTSVAVEQRPVALAIDVSRNVAAVAHATQNTVGLVSLSGTPTLTGRVSGPQIPTGVVYDPATDRFVAVSSLSNNIFIINPGTLQFTQARVGINPTSIALNFQSSTLVTANTASNTLTVMDFTDRRVRAILPLTGSSQFAVEIHAVTNVAVIVEESNNPTCAATPGRVLLVPLPR